MPTIDSNTLGGRLRTLRKSRGYTQLEMAKAMGISQGNYSSIENGVTRDPAASVIARACKFLHTTAEYLMFGAGNTADAQELILMEQEAVFLLRNAKPQSRELAMRSLRAITTEPGTRSNPFPDFKPGDRRQSAAPEKGERRRASDANTTPKES